jgi:hypothetical protein
MSESNKNTIVIVTTLCTQRINALKAWVNPTDPIDIAGQQYAQATAIGVYQSTLDAIATDNTKKSEARQATADKRASVKKVRAFDRRVQAWASNKFAAGSTAAGDFGVVPKTPVKSPATKAEAAAKAKATRVARGTKGPKAKLKIKGTIPAPSEPAAPATNPVVEGVAPATTSGAAKS